MTGHRRPQRVVRPSTRVERAHWEAGRTVIVGADAVGVASLSGPVVAAAVVMAPYARRVPGVRDSKMLSRAQRERLFPNIQRGALAVGIGAASVAEIDRINIYHATNLAMRRAICRVAEREHVLIDGLARVSASRSTSARTPPSCVATRSAIRSPRRRSSPRSFAIG